MARRSRPSYFRSLANLWPAVLAIGGVLFTDTVDGVLCSMMPKTVECASVQPAWFYMVALGVTIASIAWTAWAWYKDHVQGDYVVDLMHGTKR